MYKLFFNLKSHISLRDVLVSQNVVSNFVAMFVSDLDGTMLDSKRQISKEIIEELERELPKRRVLRCVATGRNLLTAMSVLPRDFPIDYLIFSGGSGILDWRKYEIIKDFEMNSMSFMLIVQFLQKGHYSFMAHEVVGGGRNVHCYPNGDEGTPDYNLRMHTQVKLGLTLRPISLSGFGARMSHIIVLFAEGVSFEEVSEVSKHIKAISFSRVSTVVTKSPFGSGALWLEIYASGVNKAVSSEYVRTLHDKIPIELCAAVGDDLNDEELLLWAGQGFVVENGHPRMKAEGRIRNVGSNDDGGVIEAITYLKGLIDDSHGTSMHKLNHS